LRYRQFGGLPSWIIFIRKLNSYLRNRFSKIKMKTVRVRL
jgi:hypothetical protein